MPCGEEAGKGEELILQDSEVLIAKAIAVNLPWEMGGQGKSPPRWATSLSHLNVQNQIVGKQSEILTLLINVLKLSCGSEECLPEHSSLHRGNQRK